MIADPHRRALRSAVNMRNPAVLVVIYDLLDFDALIRHVAMESVICFGNNCYVKS